MAEIRLRPFRSRDQDSVRQLILAGLADHWGRVDPDLNPDLHDIAESYAGATFMVACLDNRIIGCGAFVPRASGTAEVVRMSVARGMRRKGVGRRILSGLCDAAFARGFNCLVLETTAGWQGVRRFYERFGFVYTHFVEDEFGGQAHYALDLDEYFA